VRRILELLAASPALSLGDHAPRASREKMRHEVAEIPLLYGGASLDLGDALLPRTHVGSSSAERQRHPARG
jgi:hypothetical protein